jgi:hypothetical protein
MSSALATILAIGLLTLPVATSFGAQTVSTGDGPRGDRGNLIAVPLPNSGSVIFNPNGTIAVTVPALVSQGSASAGAVDGTRSPAERPPADIAPSLSTFLDEQLMRARFCLTMEGFLCEPSTPPSGAFNYVDTRVDVRWLAEQAALDTQRDILLPYMVLKSNPPEGLVNLPTYFWVDRATYGGQTYFQEVVLPTPWTVDWDYWVTHTVSRPCPTADDPNATCTTSTRSQEHHHEDHLDVVNVILTLTPAHYRWTFGDEDRPSAFAHLSNSDEGSADFSNGDGLGVPYSPDVTCCPSLVEHNYHQSSFSVFDQGGFPVHLEATWTATAMVRATRDGAVVLDETRALQNRVGNYEMRHQVRESQPVLVR